MTWSHGYNVDLGYTYGYYREQDPAWLELCALIKGASPPSLFSDGRLRYLELGCGQGLNLCLIASIYPHIEFIGIDFNPLHISHAQALKKLAGLTNVHFLEADFLELGKHWPESLGKFHYATAHGIISWISREVREGLYRCLDSALLPGALVYFSYNTLPGWLSTIPVQHLLRLWQVREGLPSLKAIELGFQRLMKLIEANATMCRVLPQMKVRLEKFPNLDKGYLVQEYLHDVWTNFWFDELAREVEPHKLSFLGTATASDWYLQAMLPAEWKAILAEYSDLIEREVMFDVLINQSFRRDIWVKGQAPLWPDLQRKELLQLRFALLSRPEKKDPSENPYKFSTSLGEVIGKVEIYEPLYDALATGPKTLAELMVVPVGGVSGSENKEATNNIVKPSRTIADTLQAVGLMLHQGHIAISRTVNEKLIKSAQGLNRAIFSATWQGAPYRYVVAPSIPCVLGASDSDLMLAHAKLTNPKADATHLGELFARQLLSLGRTLARDGKPITEQKDLIERAKEIAQVFLTKTLPTWQKLGVIRDF